MIKGLNNGAVQLVLKQSLLRPSVFHSIVKFIKISHHAIKLKRKTCYLTVNEMPHRNQSIHTSDLVIYQPLPL